MLLSAFLETVAVYSFEKFEFLGKVKNCIVFVFVVKILNLKIKDIKI